MNWRLLGLLSLNLALVACGGKSDEEAPPAELTGVLKAGGVAGVHFATPTRLGITDAAGTFKYLPGETITFSIGGTVLGSAPGAAEITPFTLAGLAPPTTELALRRELDRTSRIATPLGQAINIATLLIAFDADHNPDNGIVVPEKAAALVGVQLNVRLPIGAFASALQRSAPGLTANIPRSRPLVHLYRSLRISVPVHADTRAETLYASAGLRAVPSLRFNTYGPDGSHKGQGFDTNDDGNPEGLTTWTYDPLGRIKSVSTNSFPFSFWPGRRDAVHEFDARGVRTDTVEEFEYEYFAGLIESRNVYHFTADDYGYQKSEILDMDNSNDGTMDARLTTTFTYDPRHNLESVKSEVDYEIDGTTNETSTYAVTYDDLSRPLRVINELDQSGDGVADQRSETSFEYTGGAVREVETQDYNGDGIIDVRRVVDSMYDTSGQLVSRSEERDDDADGVVDGGSSLTYAYDDERRMTSSGSRVDYDGDGTFDSTNRGTFDYGDAGNLLVSKAEYDYLSDGEIDSTSTDSFEYGTSGEILGATHRDVSYNGAIDVFQSTATTVTNDVRQDGVLLLAQRYLDGFQSVVPSYPGASSADVVPPPSIGVVAP